MPMYTFYFLLPLASLDSFLSSARVIVRKLSPMLVREGEIGVRGGGRLMIRLEIIEGRFF